jgi:phosphopantetheinyl transferase (holo-ACP synthase)
VIGNDVVDLADPETDLRGLHLRFAERVFTRAERDALEVCGRAPAGPDATPRAVLHWAFWAAKESAYKALKRVAPETIFAPTEFEVDLAEVPLADGHDATVGSVGHRDRRFSLEVHRSGASLHAVVRSAELDAAVIVSKVEQASGEKGAAVRRLAGRAIGSALGLDPAALSIVRRPPVVMFQGRPLEAELSLSHHGQFIAFACSLPQAG